MAERRKHSREEIVTRVRIMLPHGDGWTPPLKGITVDASPDGLTVALYEGEDTTKLIESLMSEGQAVEVALELPATGDRIRSQGRVTWVDIGPGTGAQRYLRLGVALEHMSEEEKARWSTVVAEGQDSAV